MSDRFIAATPAATGNRRAPADIRFLVLHATEGSYEGAVGWATKTRAERAASFLRREQAAFASGKGPAPHTLEHWLASPLTEPTCAHYYHSPTGDTTQMVDDLQECWHAGNRDYNRHSIGFEHAARSDAGPGEWPDAMLRKSAKCAAVLCRKYNISVHNIIGHFEVPGATHHDPGKFFPWDTYRAMVAEELAHG